MPGCIVSAITASFRSVEKRRRLATPVITSTFENVSDIGVCPGLCLGPPAKAGVRLKRGAVQFNTPGAQQLFPQVLIDAKIAEAEQLRRLLESPIDLPSRKAPDN